MKIGLTFFLSKEGGSIWSMGAEQNCVFLWQMLRTLGHDVVAINGGDGEAPAPGLMLKDLDIDFVRMGDVADHLDLLIEGRAQVASEHVARVRARGGRAVSYKLGNAYVIDTERIIHAKPSGSIFNGSCFDEIWTIPQHSNTCEAYWETLYRCPVRTLPHVWEPLFVHKAIAEFPGDLKWGFQPGDRPKRLVILEPNTNIVKTSIVPLLACENAYRRRPDLIEAVYVTNTEQLKGHITLEHLVCSLDLKRHNKVSFEARFNTPWFLAKYGDVVVSHQWENALNYAYYEALYGGYPLIHNSDLLPDGVGYRYHGFDAVEAGNALVAGLLSHDARREQYVATSKDFLRSVSIEATKDTHQRAIDSLFS